jgi:hypothetical protein
MIEASSASVDAAWPHGRMILSSPKPDVQTSARSDIQMRKTSINNSLDKKRVHSVTVLTDRIRGNRRRFFKKGIRRGVDTTKAQPRWTWSAASRSRDPKSVCKEPPQPVGSLDGHSHGLPCREGTWCTSAHANSRLCCRQLQIEAVVKARGNLTKLVRLIALGKMAGPTLVRAVDCTTVVSVAVSGTRLGTSAQGRISQNSNGYKEERGDRGHGFAAGVPRPFTCVYRKPHPHLFS